MQLISFGRSGSKGSSGGGSLSPIAAYSYLGNSTSSSAAPVANQALVLGSPGFTPAANTTAFQITSTVVSYFQGEIQNLSSNSSASTDYVVTADNGNDSTHYADFGINSSGGGGTPFTNANAAYVYSTDNEMNVGSLGASGVVKVYTTGGTATPVLAATFTASQGLTLVGALSVGGSGAASVAGISVTGTVFTSGSATTNFPLMLFQTGTPSAVTTWSANGTHFGVNADLGFVGNFIDLHINGNTSVFSVGSGGVITCSGTIFGAGTISTSKAPSASQSAIQANGAILTGGSGTTNIPHIRSDQGAAVTTWSTAGTYLGCNSGSGFTGNFLDFHVNGASSIFNVNSAGAIACGSIGASSIAATSRISSSSAGSASTPVITTTAAPLATGTGTTNFPQWFANWGGTAVTNWSNGTNNGTVFGINAAASWTGNFFDFHVSSNTSVFQVTATGAMAMGGKVTNYNGIATVGWGSPAIYGQGRLTAQVASAASVATYTVGAADGSFEIAANVNITAATTASFTVTCTYTDENNTSRVVTFSFVQNGVAVPIQTITNVTGVGAYAGMKMAIRCKASTAITIATTGTFTSVTYNVEGTITQAA